MFGLVGMAGVAMAPLIGRAIDRLVPWYATLVGTLALVATHALQTAAAGVHIAAVVVVCVGLDVFRQSQQVSLTTGVYGLDARARSRLNTVILLAVRPLSFHFRFVSLSVSVSVSLTASSCPSPSRPSARDRR